MRRAASLLVALAAAATAPAQPQAGPAAAAPTIALDGPVAEDGPVERQVQQGALLRGVAPVGTVALTLDGRPVPVAPDRRFIIGLDRDAGPLAVLAATLDDGRLVSRDLAVAPRAWDISRLPTLPKTPLPDAEFALVRPPELAEIAAARRIVTDAAGWRQRFAWPTTGRISTLFGSQRVYANGEAGSYHSGIDIARPTGTVVVAPADGVVVLAADHPFTLEGNLLMIDHGMGLGSAFLHLSRIDVRAGDPVRQGQPVGLVGMTGRATGPHLHWSLRWQDARLDPLLVAGPMPPRR